MTRGYLSLSLLHHNNRQYTPHHTPHTTHLSSPPVPGFHFCECFDSRSRHCTALQPPDVIFVLIDEMDGCPGWTKNPGLSLVYIIVLDHRDSSEARYEISDNGKTRISQPREVKLPDGRAVSSLSEAKQGRAELLT